MIDLILDVCLYLFYFEYFLEVVDDIVLVILLYGFGVEW